MRLDSVLTGAGINVLLALGTYFTVATGQFSIGTAFMAIGPMASILTMNFCLLLYPQWRWGIAASWPALSSAPVLGDRDLYLAMATLGFGEIAEPPSTIGVGGVGGMRA